MPERRAGIFSLLGEARYKGFPLSRQDNLVRGLRQGGYINGLALCRRARQFRNRVACQTYGLYSLCTPCRRQVQLGDGRGYIGADAPAAIFGRCKHPSAWRNLASSWWLLTERYGFCNRQQVRNCACPCGRRLWAIFNLLLNCAGKLLRNLLTLKAKLSASPRIRSTFYWISAFLPMPPFLRG